MADMGTERYTKQILSRPIGTEGQRRISESKVTVIGLGALGTVSAGILCRAGVGHLRLVDRDFVEMSNLQRQTLYDEEDAQRRMPKSEAAAQALRAINSTIVIEPVIRDVRAENIEELVRGSSLVMDGTDNLETRFLINDACLKHNIPWIYGAALGVTGNTMTIVPGKTACLRCLIDSPPPVGAMPTCDTEGVLAAITGVVAAIQSAEALKLIVGSETQSSLLCIDVWERDFVDATIERRPECPACGLGHYEYLAGKRTAWTTVLCGRNSVQIVPPNELEIPLAELQERLSRLGQVAFNGFFLGLHVDDYEIILFPTGRAIIRGTSDESVARSLYARYIGT